MLLGFHANGVDESNVKEPYRPKSKGLGNSQVLPRDYVKQYEIELVLKEIAEQVAIRLRRARKKTTNVAIFIGYSKSEQKRPINSQMRIEPTQSTKTLSEVVITLFRKKYTGGAVRSIGVRYENFVSEDIVTYSLFDDVETIEKTERLERTIDDVRERFGFLAIQKASALTEGSLTIERSKLIAGHSAGGLDGLA